jgi:acyl carrier protein
MSSTEFREMSKQDIQSWVRARVAFYLERPEADIDPDLQFMDLGLDSVYAMTLSGEIEEEFGLVVEPTVAWDHPTVNQMTCYLEAELKNQ